MKLILVTLLLVSVVHSTEAHCQPGWQGSGYNNACYKLFSSASVNHATAESSCSSYSFAGKIPHLVSINGLRENHFVNRLGGNDAVWIGAENDGNGVWSWTDGSTWSYTNWHTTEPNGTGNCGYMDATGTWGDKLCGDQLQYICEYRYT